MEATEIYTGGHAVVSPTGHLIACVASGKILINETSHPSVYTQHNVLVPTKEITALRWSPESGRLAILSPNVIQVLHLGERQKVKIDNGSAGFGRFTSVEWLTLHSLLVTWEFGRVNVFDLRSGRIVELGDIKTYADRSYDIRPACKKGVECVTLLSRNSAEDYLNFYFPGDDSIMHTSKLRGMDARSLSWSPDGKWIAILQSPYSMPSLHIYTADGNFFKWFYSMPGVPLEERGLCTKGLKWSPNGQVAAVSTFTESIALLNTRTFSPLAIIEHCTTIDQTDVPEEERVPVCQEVVSASKARSYLLAPHPVSPPLSRRKASEIPKEMGVAEMAFSCDGRYLATRDERMLSTVFLWDMATFKPKAVLTQHANVRKLQWHPSDGNTLLIDCGESIAYYWDLRSVQPPVPIASKLSGTVTFTWISFSRNLKPAILATTKSSWQVLWPEGHDTVAGALSPNNASQLEASDDSLYDILSGRRSLPPLADSTGRDMSSLDSDTAALDDTFSDKRRAPSVDPLDDSEIF